MKNNKVSSCEYINGEKIYIGDKVYRFGFGIATVYNIKKEGFKSQAAELEAKGIQAKLEAETIRKSQGVINPEWREIIAKNIETHMRKMDNRL